MDAFDALVPVRILRLGYWVSFSSRLFMFTVSTCLWWLSMWPLAFLTSGSIVSPPCLPALSRGLAFVPFCLHCTAVLWSGVTRPLLGLLLALSGPALRARHWHGFPFTGYRDSMCSPCHVSAEVFFLPMSAGSLTCLPPLLICLSVRVLTDLYLGVNAPPDVTSSSSNGSRHWHSFPFPVSGIACVLPVMCQQKFPFFPCQRGH